MDIAKLIADRDPADIIHCTVDMTVRDVVALLSEKRIGALPVMNGSMVAGIFSERDLIYRIAEIGEACLDGPVGDVMTAPAITVSAHEKVLDALGRS
jgi:CBS domain-containing protein